MPRAYKRKRTHPSTPQLKAAARAAFDEKGTSASWPWGVWTKATAGTPVNPDVLRRHVAPRRSLESAEKHLDQRRRNGDAQKAVSQAVEDDLYRVVMKGFQVNSCVDMVYVQFAAKGIAAERNESFGTEFGQPSEDWVHRWANDYKVSLRSPVDKEITRTLAEEETVVKRFFEGETVTVKDKDGKDVAFAMPGLLKVLNREQSPGKRYKDAPHRIANGDETEVEEGKLTQAELKNLSRKAGKCYGQGRRAKYR